MVDYDKEVGRIVGYCQIPGWAYEQEVISFYINNGKWSIGGSMCLPSDINAALAIHECMTEAFKKLKEAM